MIGLMWEMKMIMIPGEGLYRLDQQVGQTHVHLKAMLQFAEVPVVFLTKTWLKAWCLFNSRQVFKYLEKVTAKQKMFLKKITEEGGDKSCQHFQLPCHETSLRWQKMCQTWKLFFICTSHAAKEELKQKVDNDLDNAFWLWLVYAIPLISLLRVWFIIY